MVIRTSFMQDIENNQWKEAQFLFMTKMAGRSEIGL